MKNSVHGPQSATHKDVGNTRRVGNTIGAVRGKNLFPSGFANFACFARVSFPVLFFFSGLTLLFRSSPRAHRKASSRERVRRCCR
jgi:hypothetical protein